MTTVNLKLRTTTGAPLANTWFRIEPGYQDGVTVPADLPQPVEFFSNAAGNATVVLPGSTNPWFLTKSYPTGADPVALKFFVPQSAVPLEIEVLLVDLGTHLKIKNDATLYALIDTKVAVMAALSQIKLISSVVLPGSEGLQDMVDAIKAVQAELTAYKAEITGKVDTAVTKSDQAVVRSNQAIATVTTANTNSLAAAALANQAKATALLADQHAQEGKLLGQNAIAAITALAARVTALGG